MGTAGRAEGWDGAGPTLGATSEAEALRRILPRLPVAREAVLGPGDDAAVLRAADGRYVVTTDLMVEGPDFRLAWSTPWELGWKVAASNLADVAAMGAVPTGLVVALAAPPETRLAALESLACGIRECCLGLAPGCGAVGGDLSASRALTLAVTAFGDLEGRAPVTRSGARAGDVLAHSGRLGEAARGLRLLFARGTDAEGEPDASRASALRGLEPDSVRAQTAPEPPIGDGPAASRAGATAMLDVSDGLALDARRLAAASGLALDLDPALLGPDPAAALTGGEDHGLLACFPAGTALPGGFRPIGRAVSGSGVLVDGVPYRERGGWDPYRDWDGA